MLFRKVTDFTGGDRSEVAGGCIVPHGLRCEPVLTIGAFKITTQHSKAQCRAPGKDVKERFFLYRVVLHACRIIEGNAENASFVEPDLANSPLTGTQFAKVAAGGTDQIIVGKFFDQLARPGRNIEFALECFGGHDKVQLG